MKGKEVFDPVDALRETEVKGITWGSLIDLSPRVQMSVARSLVREKKPKEATIEGVIPMEQNTVALALERTDNYFTTIQVPVGKTEAQKPQHIFRVHGVLLDVGSVLNCISDRAATQLGVEQKAARNVIIIAVGT